MALFAWFTLHLDFLSRKEFQRPRHVRIFLFGLLPIFKRVSRSLVNNQCRSVLEYSLTGKDGTLFENKTFFEHQAAFFVGTFSQTG